jgi:hypothetical protein
VLISALDQVIEDLEDFVEAGFDDLDSLLSSSYVANFQIFNPGTTLISGNKISTGTIDANSVSISSGGGGATQGVKINQNGITAYDSFGFPTFFLNSANGNATFTGTISGSNITSSTISSGLIQSFDFIGTANGANFSTDGTAINLSDGSVTSREFRIDTFGNAVFAGTLSAADGTFSGTLSAGVSIDSPTITGGILRTATSGARLEIQSFFNGIFFQPYIIFYDEFGNQVSLYTQQRGSTMFFEISGLPLRVSSGIVLPVGATITGNGSGLSGTATNLSIGGNAATATSATSATSATTATNLSGGTINNGTVNAPFAIGISGAASTGNVLVKAGNGNMLLGGTTITSSIKIKENINNFVNYENIYDLNPVTFYLKDEFKLESSLETKNMQIGFIAEEVAEVIPEAVQYRPDSDEIYNYSERVILAVAVKAIQEQKKMIDDLQKRIVELESK